MPTELYIAIPPIVQADSSIAENSCDMNKNITRTESSDVKSADSSVNEPRYPQRIRKPLKK